MRLGLMEFDWAYIGAALARGDDKEQSDFLKGFIKECLTWGTAFQVEQQLAAVNMKLTKQERETLKMLSFDEE
jgi:hypothetical protein